jgi:hypothetical protein
LPQVYSFNEVGLSDRDVNGTVEAIKLKPSFVTDFEHPKHVKNMVAQKSVKQVCPSCGSERFVREAKRGSNVGQKLLGGASDF